jgi:hypothetical protein
MPEAGVAPTAVASSVTSVSKVTVTMTSPRAEVLKISVGTKRPGVAPLSATKGKQARLDAEPPLTSAVPLKVTAQP